ncbi:glycoside hydrolase family 2 TIM barrel-domain containing protein [Paractinoplanes toevensis]|uniref:Beta-galactosidase n=1 Tax=Paractinoplanes toevensis TaxID=571911 RepID=A0A919T6S7_9ACTN|nr:glycoside hydrolase family 2 TIM barrel-domain containing protein [Actinoplanes toevensis]GIM90075.1 beta-galactosidase [Actinoplanes toevensis]
MGTTLFTDGWSLQRLPGAAVVPVRLPHDAMLAEPRGARGGTGTHGGYFPGGRYRYAKRWTAPDDAARRRLSLVFEGVHGRTVVQVDGVPIGRCASGYREFTVPLHDVITPGGEHLIEVDADNREVPNSRWYTGAGIYRPVWLENLPEVHLPRDGVRVHTHATGEPTLVEVGVDVAGPAPDSLTVEVRLGDAVRATAPVTGGTAELRLAVPEARLWSHDHPHLYNTTVSLLDGDVVLHRRTLRAGLRTLHVDAERGLLVNGEHILLRGACVHHDSGVLGAATFRASEFRRARILKANGYNAIRSAHNPISRDLLDACDEIGLYVMDELTDTWYQSKTAHDAAPDFAATWRDDARAMIGKDHAHPSVIMYSIGNEITETATAQGARTARELHDFITRLDPHRPTTVAINLLLNIMATRGKSPYRLEEEPAEQPKPSRITSTAANVLTNRLGAVMRLISQLPVADRVSRDAFAAVDIAGYNYAFSRYLGDRRRHPGRVILGTESMPGDLPRIWPLVERVPGVLGDFMWTGWDYLGEAGIGTWAYGDQPGGLHKPYPALIAGPGAIDITGLPGAPALLARAVWGELTAPAIAVRPLDRSGQRTLRTAWRASDAVPSWAWRGCEGRTAEIEVYSADDEVELLLNGRSLGRRRPRRFLARFRTPYQPGELVAVGYRDGHESGRSRLTSAGPARLRLVAESEALTADGQDLAFVHIQLADEDGTVEMLAADTVTITVAGPGHLTAFGSAAPQTEETFTGDTHTTYRGRALAVIRADDQPGTITITATSRRHGTATAELQTRTP